MVFVYYHEEDVEIESGVFNRIKNTKALEKRLTNLRWSNLKWCPAEPENKDVGWILYGCPPNYKGNISGYLEEAIEILVSPENPFNDSGKIKVRDFLNGPVFDSEEGVGWGYLKKEDMQKVYVCK